ncbi:MAG: DNA primase [Burkholderiales bacterium]|nr:DNA primase [Bacteroidia bacterium]
MIPKFTIDKIIDAARVEDVIGDFITLKKRGANLLGLCPFHGEKSPSFTVSPAKGIYKCFGCGKSGTAVNFIMDLESLSYPEALRWLANKYGIEVIEKEISVEEKAQQNEKESLYIVMQYSQKYYTDLLMNDDLGRSIGLGYFKERGFTQATIDKFQLGYSSEERRKFSETAVKNSYKPEYLVKTGMSILSNNHVEGNPITVSDIFDRYTGRVMFPILNISGKVIGFGGRILITDKKQAKYINSPQTDIYDKSKTLYGLFQAKKQIIQDDNCYLVEGYTDVISMHQSNIENVVSSSGTSLTVEQIKLIHRFTKNITILYDGDVAGIKASFRGIDLILEEGMNVRVLLFPDGDDPDSYSKKVTNDEFKEFIKTNSKDFISFKTSLLYKEVEHDPIRRAELIKDIVESISVIPDAINRSVYVKECSRIMDISEQILQIEINKLIRKKTGKQGAVSYDAKGDKYKGGHPDDASHPVEEFAEEEKLVDPILDSEEKELLRMMMQYGNVLVEVEAEDTDNAQQSFQLTVCEFVIFELWRDNLQFINPVYQMVLDEFQHELESGVIPTMQTFTHHSNPAVAQVAINIASFSDIVSYKWEKFGVSVPQEIHHIKKGIEHQLFSLKEKRLNQIIKEAKELVKTADPFEHKHVYEFVILLENQKKRVNKILGRTIIR